MRVNRIQSNNSNNQPNFKGVVGASMKKYISSQMERELADLSARDKKFGPFTNMPLLFNRVKTLHTQVQDKLSNIMKAFDPNISMEYEHGVVKLQNNDSKKALSFVSKDSMKVATGEVYGNKIDVFSPEYIDDSGELTLYYINSFAGALEDKILLSKNVRHINKTLAK